MNDQFLQNYRKPPRQAFVQALRRRLEIHQRKAEKMSTFHLRPVLLGALTLILALALFFAISPAARAQLQDWIGQVGGVLFTATTRYPGGGPVTTVDEDLLSIAEARETLPFAINLPTWVPEGYTLRERVTVPHFEDQLARVAIRWSAPEKAELMLTIEKRPAGAENRWVIGDGSLQEITVHGQPAALVRGAWDYDEKQWSHAGILTLFWPHDGQTYNLQAHEEYIPIEDLVRIAESIP